MLGTQPLGAQPLAGGEAVSAATLTDINTDEIILDGESGVTFTTSGFGSEINAFKVYKSGTAYETSLTSVSSTGGAGTANMPDISAFSGDTLGTPFTTASHSIVGIVGDGTDTATLGVTLNPKAGWAVVETASAVKTTGSVFENFVGTITDGSQVYYPTANNTSVSATGILTTDATSNIGMQFWDASDGTWKQFSVVIASTAGGLVRDCVHDCVSDMVRDQVRS